MFYVLGLQCLGRLLTVGLVVLEGLLDVMGKCFIARHCTIHQGLKLRVDDDLYHVYAEGDKNNQPMGQTFV